MGSRMDKYYDNTGPVGSRAKKNEDLYQEISQSDLDNVNLTSNAHVIGDNDSNIDIGKIKKLLEKKYYEEPKKNNSLYQKDEYFLDDEIDSEEETKEYDINAILKKAKLDKEVDYERERLKKIHDTQYDILRNLDLKKQEKEEPESKVTSHKEDLMNLINTITEKEMTRGLNPLDILTDLKGSDNTEVLAGVSEKVNEEINNENKNSLNNNPVKDDPKRNIDKTFYTNSLSFTQSDFDDFNDLKEDVETNKLLVRVLLIIITIALVVGIVFLANAMFHLNWF